jgi:hypothetical protein
VSAVSTALVLLLSLVAPPAAPTPTVDEIVAKHVAARGGSEALRALRTVRMTGRATAGPGREAIVRREIARPGRIRTEFVFQGTTGVYAWDGSRGWRVSPLEGQLDVRPLPADEAAATADQADLEGPLVGWRQKGHKVELVGSAALPGGPAHELKVTLKSGGVRRLFVDAASGQIVKMESTRRLRGHEETLETVFGDYRPTGGVSFARTIDIGVKDRPRRLHIVVENVETNVPLDDARFQMPR